MIIKLGTSAICIFRMLPTNVELFKAKNQPTNQPTNKQQQQQQQKPSVRECSVQMKHGYP